eukprot:TRINITY_DN6938_c0_g1_i1.p1 TRINITY_DN6938_c0_g1~~TRINITY_DN6938_c0_g1_i1.p1  ORF type:complete len:571 (+),score=143.89 TRINITY_DN6938_c0_g1_i1:52-1713(+)
MFAHTKRVVGEETFKKIQEAKVLVCGAGGIGCELLKSLVLTGFEHIEVIDLDTVDSSNLNRQFLFRPKHVSKPKAVVARESVMALNPKAEIKAYYDNVKSQDYEVEFYKKFDIILNGLDNRSARSHVNRLAMKANIPLVESGTMGYNGQVQPIIKDETQCYDCFPKQTGQVSFAVCTIHQKPSSMTHCVHYAKEFYKRFFGEQVDQDPELETLLSYVQPGQPAETWVGKVFNGVFSEKINELKNLKKDANCRELTLEAAKKATADGTEPTPALETQRIKTVAELSDEFAKAFTDLTKRQEKIPWDKDDPLALQLTVAVANLRAWNFFIDIQSEFAIKSLAGNIIPAIATSNAVISGGIILEALKILKGEKNKVKVQSLRRFPARIKRKDCYIVPENAPQLNPKCYVCQSGTNTMYLKTNILMTTVRFVVKTFCEHELSMPHPMISLVKGEDEKLIYEDEEMTANEAKPLSTWIPSDSIQGWSILLEDMLQELTAELVITHDPTMDPSEYILTGTKPVAGEGKDEKEGDNAGDELVSDDDEVVAYHPKKNKGLK